MDPDQSELSLALIERLKHKGHSQSEIARMTGNSRQAVSWHLRRYGGRLTPRQEVLENHFPWMVSAEQQQQGPFRSMRNHGEYMVTNGKGMSQDKRVRLTVFYRKIREEDVVLEFDPLIPPEPGIANKGGFAFRKRIPSDQDLLIRVNDHTCLTEDGQWIWCLPSVEPHIN